MLYFCQVLIDVFVGPEVSVLFGRPRCENDGPTGPPAELPQLTENPHYFHQLSRATRDVPGVFTKAIVLLTKSFSFEMTLMQDLALKREIGR